MTVQRVLIEKEQFKIESFRKCKLNDKISVHNQPSTIIILSHTPHPTQHIFHIISKNIP